MKAPHRISSLLAAAALAGVVGCDPPVVSESPAPPGDNGAVTADDVRRETAEAADVASKYARQEGREFRERMESQMAELDAQSARLRERMSDLSADARAEAEARLDDAARHRAELERQLERIDNASAEAWSDVKAGAESAWQELKSAVNQAADHFDE